MGFAEFPEADKMLFSGKVCQWRLAGATLKDGSKVGLIKHLCI